MSRIASSLTPVVPLDVRSKLTLLKFHSQSKWNEIASITGISAVMLSACMTGRKVFNDQKLDALADCFGVHRSWLKDDQTGWPPNRTWGRAPITIITMEHL